MIKITAAGLTYSGAPLELNTIRTFDAPTEAALVLTGKAAYMPQGDAYRGNPFKQSGVPIIYAPTGTFNTTGQFTSGTALPYQPVGVVQTYFVASNGLAAGLYNTIWSSTTICQIVGSPTTTSGAYTALTTAQNILTVPIPGGSLGPNGRLRVTQQYRHTGSTNSKTEALLFGGSTVNSNAYTAAGSLGSRVVDEIINRGVANSQITGFNGNQNSFGTILTASPILSIDTTVDQNLVFQITLATATEVIMLDSYQIELFNA